MNSSKMVAKLFVKAGINKVHRPIVKFFILSIFGGFFVGLSSGLSSLCQYNLIEGYSQFYKGMVFPIGIIIVYCGGGELITGNCLLTVAFFSGKITILEMLLSWLIVLVGNFIGCLLVSLLVVYSHIPNMFNVNMAKIIIDTGNAKCGANFGEAFILALLANYCNCLGLWVAMIGKDMKSVILALFIPNFLLMALDLNHLVADMYYIFAGLFTCYEYGLDLTEMSWGKLFYKSIIPELLGSFVGGGILVGVIYWYIFLFKEPDEINANKKTINFRENVNEKETVNKDVLMEKNADFSSLKMINNNNNKNLNLN